jgi:hypothetical protein
MILHHGAFHLCAVRPFMLSAIRIVADVIQTRAPAIGAGAQPDSVVWQITPPPWTHAPNEQGDVIAGVAHFSPGR